MSGKAGKGGLPAEPPIWIASQSARACAFFKFGSYRHFLFIAIVLKCSFRFLFIYIYLYLLAFIFHIHLLVIVTRPYLSPEALSRDSFSRLALDDGKVGTLLRRFSAGRAEHVELMPWQTMVERREMEKESQPTSNERPMLKTSAVDDLDQPLPRRKGYFLAVQSARESALYQELESIKLERIKDDKERTLSALDLELREREIRKELKGEVNDTVARREYRRKVQKFMHRSRPNSAVCKRHKVVCQGHLWTASSNHLARGGVLPAGVPRPITPTAMQAALRSVARSNCSISLNR